MIDYIVNLVPSHATEFRGNIRIIAVVKSDLMNRVPAERLTLRQTPCLIELEIHQVIPVPDVYEE
jgi:hypothetical protein